MSQELEIEYKNLLTKTEYDRIMTEFQLNHENPFTQTNYYFDTTDFQLKAHHSALRIRTRPDQSYAEMTLKNTQRGAIIGNNHPTDYGASSIIHSTTNH